MDNLPTDGLLARGLACLCLAGMLVVECGATESDTHHLSRALLAANLSPMAKIAQRFSSDPQVQAGYMEGPPIAKSQFCVATDSSGSHVVVVFNDPRGFSKRPISTTGFIFSNDGGRTFMDGGQMPATAEAEIFGHPDIKYLGGSTFICLSLMVRTFEGGRTAQTIALFRSRDYGSSWDGPFEVPSATFPHDQNVSICSSDVADRPFMDVDTDTGRVLVSWTNYTESDQDLRESEILTSYSDDVLNGNPPTWSNAQRIDREGAIDNAPVPRFGHNGRAYIAYTQTLTGSQLRNIAVASSVDGGISWSVPHPLRRISTPAIGLVPGADSASGDPSLAVDLTQGAASGTVYVAYSDDSSGDGGDIAFQRSVDGGNTFSPPMIVNRQAGRDRAQWAPNLCVDNLSGRVHLVFWDQSVKPFGDLTQAMHLTSDDGGVSWSAPAPILPEPIHAAFGSNASQPNFGDYMQAECVHGQLMAAFPTKNVVRGFSEDAVRHSSPLYDVRVFRQDDSTLPVVLRDVTFQTIDGRREIGAGDTVQVHVSLSSTCENIHYRQGGLSELSAHLACETPGVTVVHSTSRYDLNDRTSEGAGDSFVIEVSHRFILGTPIRFVLELESAGGHGQLPFQIPTGHKKNKVIFSEGFAQAAEGALPPNWVANHVGGSVGSRWRVAEVSGEKCLAQSFPDAETGTNVFETVESPVITIPKEGNSAAIDFDIAYDTGAQEGCALRLVDVTNGAEEPRLIDSVAEDFSRMVSNEEKAGYSARLPISESDALQNVSVWSGRSFGYEHVHASVPGMAGRRVRLRWDYVVLSPCAGKARGISIKNVEVSTVAEGASALGGLEAKPMNMSVHQDQKLEVSKPGLLNAVLGAKVEDLVSSLGMPPSHGKALVLEDGSFSYQPNPGYVGADRFTYTVRSKSKGETRSIVNLMVNPTLIAASLPSHIRSGGPVTVEVRLSSPAPAEGATVDVHCSNDLLLPLPPKILIPGLESVRRIDSEAAYVTGPVPVQISFQCDGILKVCTAVIAPESVTTPSDQAFTVGEGRVLSQPKGCLFSAPSTTGNASPYSVQMIEGPSHGALVLKDDGSFNYAPKPGYNGHDRFTFQVAKNGLHSGTATVTIHVLPRINQLIVGSHRMQGGSPTRLTVQLTGPAPQGGLSVHFRPTPLLVDLPQTVIVPEGKSECGVRVITQAVSRPATLSISAEMQSEQVSAPITLLPYSPPQIRPQRYEVTVGEKLILSAPGLLNGAQAGSANRIMRSVVMRWPSHGGLRANADGSFTYAAAQGFTGVDRFAYAATDGIGQSSTEEVAIAVHPKLGQLISERTEVTAGETISATLMLSDVARVEPMRIALESPSTLIQLPQNVIVPVGQRFQKFFVTARDVTAPELVLIRAKLNGNETTVLLVVRPRATHVPMPSLCRSNGYALRPTGSSMPPNSRTP